MNNIRNSSINVLLIEDNPGDARLVQEFLHEGNPQEQEFEVTSVERLSDGIEKLKTNDFNNFDVVILDLNLPDSAESYTFRKIKTISPNIPVVILTGSAIKRTPLKECLDNAESYLVKSDIDSKSLVSATLKALEGKK